MPFEHEQPRRRGRPIKRTNPSHVIHDDGTYSNNPAKEVLSPVKSARSRLKPGQIFKTKSGSQYQLMEEAAWGVWVYNFPYKYQPRVQDCEFWDNEKLEKELG